jgi:hypothetical protein
MLLRALIARIMPPAFALMGCACHSEPRPASHAVSRDSAGIQIVESTAPLGVEYLPWTIDTVPLIDLGARQDDPHEQFSGTVAPRRLGDGQLVVATSGASELRFFDSTGAWLHSVGRVGQGPGEFQSLGWLAIGTGDTLRTYDWNLRRLSVFTPAGTFARSYLLASPGLERGAIPRAVLADGRILVSSTPFVMPGHPSGVARDTAPLLLYSTSGAVVDSFGRFPGSEALIEGTANSVTVTDCPFGKDLVIAVAPTSDAIYLGSQDTPEVRVWTPTGRLARIIRWQAPPIPVTEKDRTVYLESMAQRARPGQEEFQKRLRRMVQEAALPLRKPAFAGLVAGPNGTFWIQAYTAPDPHAATPFHVFDSTGQWLGTLTLPARFTAHQIGEDFLLGTWQDPDDIDHVRLYRLARRRSS